jgi:hypothetical protein
MPEILGLTSGLPRVSEGPSINEGRRASRTFYALVDCSKREHGMTDGWDAAIFEAGSEWEVAMRVPTKVLGTIAILCAAVVTPVSAKHHGRTHNHWHYRAPNTWQYAPYAVPLPLDRIDPSRPGGLDPSFTPRAK